MGPGVSGADPDWVVRAGPLRPLLTVGALAFGAASRLRGALYDAGVLAETKVACPVISVGNLSVGGTGKTPLTITLAQRLIAAGANVVVLSRGYGASSPPPAPTIVARRGQLEQAPAVSGDEPALIAKRSAASVIVGGDRVAAAALAIRELAADVLLLDDGYQHRRLARDLNILVVDAAAPLGNGRLLPAGPLREGPSAAARADLVVRNHGASVVESEESLPVHAPRVDVKTVATSLVRGSQRLPVAELEGRRVALVAAIARPQRFEATVVGLGAEVVHRAFVADHRAIGAPVWQAAGAAADLVLTTEKDEARAPALADGVWALAIDCVVHDNEAALDAALQEVLHKR